MHKVNLPKICPACGHTLVWQGLHLACPNIECGDAAVQDLLIWSSQISPYMGLGDLLKIKFFDKLLGDNISIESVYEKGEPITQVDAIDSSQFRDFANMWNGLYTNKVDLVTAIRALNVPRLGEVNSKKLAKYPDIVKQLMSGIAPSIVNLATLRDIGDANWSSIVANVAKFHRLNYIESNISFEAYEETEEIGKVAITGKLSMKRGDFEVLLASKGFKVVSSLSKDTQFLITDDPSSGSSKNKQADKLGVQKITEEEFTRRFLSND